MPKRSERTGIVTRIPVAKRGVVPHKSKKSYTRKNKHKGRGYTPCVASL